jgi:hypothetical protein
VIGGLRKTKHGRGIAEWLEEGIGRGREGDEKITFVYGL